MKKRKSTKLKTLSNWDWTTLVASWRYYEMRMTIASAMFPAEIIERFFSGKYTKETCDQIANQFANIDHGIRGEKDWNDSQCLHDCDKEPWCKFYAFCKGWCDGFKTLVLDGRSDGRHIHEEPECFWCDYTQKWHPVKQYIEHPLQNYYVSPSTIKEIKQ